MNLVIDWYNIMLEAIRAVGKPPSTSPDLGRRPAAGGAFDRHRLRGDLRRPAGPGQYRQAPAPNDAAQACRAAYRAQAAQGHRPSGYRASIDPFPPAIYDPAFKGTCESLLKNQLARDGIAIGGATPPFAEFTSGRSGFSMAAATVLRKFTGSDAFGFFYSQNVPLKADPTEPVTDAVPYWPTFTSARSRPARPPARKRRICGRAPDRLTGGRAGLPARRRALFKGG